MSSRGGSSLYSAKEVSSHDKPDDLWIVLHGKVYDVTRFLKEHPGGEEVLINLAGKDGTRCFDDIGHSEEAKMLKDTYEIGRLEGGSLLPTTTTTTTTTEGEKQGSSSRRNSVKGDEDNDDDGDGEYEEQERLIAEREKSSSLPMIIAAGVVIYAFLIYYLFY